MQNRTWGTLSYLYTSTSDLVGGVTATQVKKTGAGWSVDQWKGMLVIPNIKYQKFIYKILSNTADTITIDTIGGPPDNNINTYYCKGGNTFAIVWGKLVKENVSRSNVKFFRETGANSFADGDATIDGICQVCHTRTKYFTNSGLLDNGPAGTHPAAAGADCAGACHTHSNGFLHGCGGVGCGTSTTCHGLQKSHPAHVSGTILSLDCSECHNTSNFPQFKDGANSKSATAVCSTCHSSNGVLLAKQYFSYPGSSSNTAGSWAYVEGQQSFCGSCHDSTPGNSKSDGTGNNAFNVMGDNSTYGYYVTGHGKASGTYARLSWQDSAASGNPAANRSCGDCHNLTTQHFNAAAKRLKSGYENDNNNGNCKQCHNPGNAAVADPQWYTTYAAYESSAHKAVGNLKCSDCHDVHGASGSYIGMTNLNQESLCNQASCHSGMGGHPGVGSTTFTIGSKNYALECISCHNVHIVTGKYADADQNKSPVTKLSDNTNVWGDAAGEKMNAYAGSRTYRTPKGESLTGAQLPDYASFCLDCHGTGTINHNTPAVSPYFGITWDGDPHGRQSANEPNGYGYCPNWPSCGEAFGWDGDDCTSDQATCWPVVPRGAGDELFSRPVYTHTERIAGANFVLSCTDCHTGHGSGTLGRPNVNGGSFSGIWNAMCNNCHYYYSDWHDEDGVPGGRGMGCGTNSCHENASIHRMKKYTGSGGTRTQTPGLTLHYAFERNLKDSDKWQMDGKWYSTSGSYAAGKSGQGAVFGSDIVAQVGTEDSNWSTDDGHHGTWKYTEMKYNTTIEAWVKPTADQNYHAIFTKHVGYAQGGYEFALKKIGGDLRVVFYMQADNNEGAQGGAAGVKGAYSTAAIPLNAWSHVAATFDRSGPDRNAGDPSVGRIRIYVNGVDVTTSDSSGSLMQPGASETSIFAYSENSPWNQSICYNGTWCASEFAIGGYAGNPTYNNFTGMIDEAKVWNITKPVSYFDAIDASIAPQIVSVVKGSSPDIIVVTFSKGVYTNSNQTGALIPSDFVYTCTHGKSITGVTHTAGSDTAILTVSPVLDYNDINVDTIAAASNQIFDRWGTALGTTAVTITGDDGVAPTISSAVISSANKITVAFSEGVYANTGGTGDLLPSDFVYTNDDGRTITAVTHMAGGTTAVLTLSTNLDADDSGNNTIAAAANSIFDDMSRPMGTTPATTLTGSLCPSIANFEMNWTAKNMGDTVLDESGLLSGVIARTTGYTGTLQAISGDGSFHGDGGTSSTTSRNYIKFEGQPTCLQASTNLTIEARIQPQGIANDKTTNYARRIFDKADASNSEMYQMSVWRLISSVNWPNYVPAENGAASIALWSKPTDAHGGQAYKPVLTEATNSSSPEYCPILNNHWYYVKAVWNAATGGASGHPTADIFVEDQGTDGLGAGQRWSGLKNCTDADQSQFLANFKLSAGDTITSASGKFILGGPAVDTNDNHFNGLIDWVKVQNW